MRERDIQREIEERDGGRHTHTQIGGGERDIQREIEERDGGRHTHTQIGERDEGRERENWCGKGAWESGRWGGGGGGLCTVRKSNQCTLMRFDQS